MMARSHLYRRRWTSLLLPFVLIVAFIYIASSRHGSGQHTMQPELFKSLVKKDSTEGIGTGDASRICKQHGFGLHKEHGQRRRQVYDLFMLAQELEWLEIRLHTLAPYVDYFVIIESTKTFTAMPKPLILRENWDAFAAFHHKILYFVVDDILSSTRAWDHEDFVRNAMLYQAFPALEGTQNEAKDGDVMVVSDIDEIPRPETILLLRHCDFPERLTLRSRFYYYSFQWLHRGQEWEHPQATVYHGVDGTISPKDLRNGEDGPGWVLLRPLMRWWQRGDLWNAAWHCSWCFSSISEMHAKMYRSSHTPWNTEDARNHDHIIDRVRHGLDIFGRKDQFYDRIEDNRDMPEYVLGDRDRFRHMLDRDGEDAGFSDVELI